MYTILTTGKRERKWLNSTSSKKHTIGIRVFASGTNENMQLQIVFGIKNIDYESVVPTIVEGDKETSREQFDIQSRLDEKEHIHLSENKVNIDLLKVIELTAFIYNYYYINPVKRGDILLYLQEICDFDLLG
ncbi:hypothetical protein ACJX0J_035858, partial [Zea mays]